MNKELDFCNQFFFFFNCYVIQIHLFCYYPSPYKHSLWRKKTGSNICKYDMYNYDICGNVHVFCNYYTGHVICTYASSS